MVSKRFKVIYLPYRTAKKREINLSRRLLFGALSVVILGLIAMFIFSVRMVIRYHDDQRVLALSEENRTLMKQLDELALRIGQVGDRLQKVEENDDLLRVFVDLPQLDPDVREVGVGGSELPEKYSITLGDRLLIDLEKMEREIDLERASYQEIRNKMLENERMIRHIPSRRPVMGGRITSGFGQRKDPFTGKIVPHHGIDISARRGTPVYAAADGKVCLSRRTPGFGLTIKLDHGYGYHTVYGHMSKMLVKRGQRVTRGQKIGEVGNTGRSTAPHLHYEVQLDKKPVNPMNYFFEGMAKL